MTGEMYPLPSHYRHCFGCGREHPTGLHMQVAGGGKRVEGSFLVTEHHQGAPGLAHGGVLAAAVDEGMGFLLYLHGKPAVTGHLEVDYRRPVPVGTELRLEGEIDRVVGRKIFAWMRGMANGEVAVDASAIFIMVPVDHFVRHSGRDPFKEIERPYNP